jgi:hypothetical protein
MKLHLETHKYDGIIGNIYRTAILNDPCRDFMTFTEALCLIEQWLEKSSIKNKHSIVNAIRLMKNDHGGNHDGANGINVEELLPRVVNNVKTFDASGIDLFLENIGEISTLGSCAQGRTTRLLGFYIPYF